MKIQTLLFSLAIAIVLAMLGSTPVDAMDTDVYLRTQSTATAGAPNVLLILDNSGSMNECPDGTSSCALTNLTYTSSIDYCDSSSVESLATGAGAAIPAGCSSAANRIYYGNTPPAFTSTQWFASNKNNCLLSASSLDSPGYFAGDQIAFWNGTKWAKLQDNGGFLDAGITAVDCQDDNAVTSGKKKHSAHGTALNDGRSPGSGATQYVTGTSGLFSYTGSTLTLYSANYLAFVNNSVLTSTTSGGTKIQVAKQALTDLINSNKSVRFGLMIFNENSSGSSGITCFSANGGNCSGGRMVFAVDDMDDARRAAMTSVIAQINAETSTPLAETMYEAYRYYAGLPLVFGNGQSPQVPARDLTAETYTTQTTAIPNGTQTSTGAWVVPSSETYIAPEEFSCQLNNIILVTDGDPTSDTNANSAITTLTTGTSSSSCSGLTAKDSSGNLLQYKCPTVSNPNKMCNMVAAGSDCLDVLASWMYANPINPSVSNSGVATYTVGFGTGLSPAGKALLDNTAKYSGTGQAYQATSATALNNALNSSLQAIQAFTSSFTAPSLSINAFNKQFNTNYLYLSQFFPSSDVSWDGNVKKYRFCTAADITSGVCASLTDVLDQNGKNVLDNTGNFLATAQSFWSATADGSTISAGGAGSKVPAFSLRNMYTYYSSGGGYSGLTSPSVGVQVSTTSTNTFYTAVAADPTLLGLPASATSAQVQGLINWILGQDTYNTSNPTGQRPWTFGDPLHSTVAPVTLGKDSSGNPITKLIVGNNDGVIRMINENTGVEEWSFLPQELYAMQYALSQGSPGTHLNGVDGAPSIWIQDINKDGIITPGASGTGDHVYMFVGMRRGGRNIYAFDITPDHTLTSQNDKSTTQPKLMWVIKGGSGSFAQLGQTWSQPQRVRVRFSCTGTVCNDNNSTTDDSKSRQVLIFAGGYDPHQDTAIPAGIDTMGNAIYMVDPYTGDLIWWASSNSGANLVLAKMLYSIPSDLQLIDSNNDGYVDRMYVGDTGGQLWRIDLGTTLGASGGVNGGSTGYVFADIGCGSSSTHTSTGACPSGSAVQDTRKFFYPPDHAPVSEAVYSSISTYDLVTIGSGDREDPLDLLTAKRVTPASDPGNEPVHNRLYAFRDCNYAPGAPTVNCVSKAALASGVFPSPFTESDLYDATSNTIGTSTGSSLTAAINSLRATSGWYISLKSLNAVTLTNGLSTKWVGEKVLAPTVMFNGVLFATTYTPPNVASSSTNACQPAMGTAIVYALDALDAAAATDVVTTPGNRAGGITVGSGIPSQVVIVFSPDGTTGVVNAGAGAGGATVGQGSPALGVQGVPTAEPHRVYWREE